MGPFGLRRRKDSPSPLVGEGFPPDARSATNGGKGEGKISLAIVVLSLFLTQRSALLTPHHAPRGACALPQGESGSLWQACLFIAAARLSVRLMSKSNSGPPEGGWRAEKAQS
jgi:hypothetical protein